MSKRFKPRGNRVWTKIPVIFDDKKPVDIPFAYPKRTGYTRSDFSSRVGEWISFRTERGEYRGIVERLKNDAVLIKMPKEYAKTALADYVQEEHPDVQLAGGYGGCDGCHPHVKPYPWYWFWFPFVIIIFIVPWFWW
jgi:hypothetical protein